METMIIDTLGQAPIVIGMLVTAYYLLRELERRDKVWREFFEEERKHTDVNYNRILDSHHKTVLVIEELSKQIAGNTRVLAVIASTMKTDDENIKRFNAGGD